MNRPRPWMVISGVCVLGLILGIAWPTPELPPVPKNQDDTWNPATPEQLSRFSDKDLQLANQGMRWVGDRTATGEAAWRFAGVVKSPQPNALILTTGNNAVTVLNLQVGDTLPDGSRVTGIDRDKITVSQNNLGKSCTRTYQLHHKKPDNASPECAEAPGNTAQGNGS